MSSGELVFNGIDGQTGEYLFDRLAMDDVEQRLGLPLDDARARELRYIHDAGEPHFGLVHNLCAEKLDEAGWGLVVPDGTDPAILEALAPLRQHRRSEAAARYYELELTAGTDKRRFLAAHGVGPGPANPAKLPYYLLLVGAPDAISYEFQYELDSQYAVGRIAFDTVAEYRCYAESVVAAETGESPARPRLTLFGPCRDADRATVLSSTELVERLGRELADDSRAGDVGMLVGADATKARLCGLLFHEGSPEVLFTAGHGIGFKKGNSRRRELQGALVAQDWPGPGNAVRDDHYLSGTDVPSDRPVRARVIMSFACFGAGTPESAAHPAFVARLPQRLLGNPAGGALAYVGHVDRALGYSYMWPNAGTQTDHFASVLRALMDGWRVGHAKEYFDARALDVTWSLRSLQERANRFREAVDPFELAELWTASHDACNYVVLGDPAVRAHAH